MSNLDLETKLSEAPEQVAKALLNWRKSTLDRERTEAVIYARLKAENPDRTATEIKHLLNASQERYESVLAEISFESTYTSYYESLLAAKHLARLREAF